MKLRIKRHLLLLAAMIAALAVCLLAGCSDGPEEDPTIVTDPVTEPAAQEYDLLWPDLLAYLGSDRYTTELVTSRLTHDTEVNNGETGYLGKIAVAEEDRHLLEDFIALVQEEYHFELVEVRDDTIYFFRFTGSNAPGTVRSLETEYHCMLNIEQGTDGVLHVTHSWLDSFERHQGYTAPPAPQQTEPEAVIQPTVPAETKPRPTEPKPTEPKETEPPALGPVLPDPTAFFGGGVPLYEDQPAGQDGWHVYYKMEIFEGYQAAHEYMDLLSDPRFQLTMRPRKDTDTYTILYLTSEEYFFDYTGSEAITPVKNRYYHDGYQDYTADVYVSIQKNAQDGYTGITIEFSNDMAMRDLGDRASNAAILSPGGSGGGGQSGGYDPVSKVPCGVCNGSGDCQTCGGDGYLHSSASDKEDRNCYKCHPNRGQCSSCGGDGWLS